MPVDARSHIFSPRSRRQAAAASSSSTSVWTNLADLDIPLTLGAWLIQGDFVYRTAATGTGIWFDLSGSTCVGSGAGAFDSALTASIERKNFIGLPTVQTFAQVIAANTDYLANLKMILNVTTAGIFKVRFRSEVNGSQVTLQPYSFLRAEPIPPIP